MTTDDVTERKEKKRKKNISIVGAAIVRARHSTFLLYFVLNTVENDIDDAKCDDNDDNNIKSKLCTTHTTAYIKTKIIQLQLNNTYIFRQCVQTLYAILTYYSLWKTNYCQMLNVAAHKNTKECETG